MSFGAALGRLVKSRREAAKLTERRLAAKAFGSFDKASVIEDLEAGRIPRPPSSVVSALADALTIRWDEISACRNSASAGGPGGPKQLMDIIGRSFDAARPHAGATEKRAYLALKLNEYKTIRANLVAMARRGDKLRILAESLRRHLEEGDVEAAEAMLDRADRLRQHESMRATMRRELAAVALLTGRAARAAKLFEEAAELLEPFSPEGAAEIRDAAGAALYQHALVLRAGWELPAVFYKRLITFYSRRHDPENWAKTENNLANARFAEAMSATKQARAALLPPVIEGYRSALTVFTKSVKPARWAQSNYNLAEALAALSEHFGRREADELLEEAVDRMRKALGARSQGADPGLWATTAHDFALLLSRRAEAMGSDGARYLEEAAKVEAAALRVFSIESTPDHWAAANNCLANIQRKRAAWADQNSRSLYLEDAVGACRNALKVYNRADDPGAWASVQNNLALALKDQARQLGRAESA
ncbi:MAG: helix-turn-helix transcriptional regulator, partial [Pseudomonadota bacterium]